MRIVLKVPGVKRRLDTIIDLLFDIRDAVVPTAVSVKVVIEGKEGEFTMLENQKVTASLKVTDANGKKARIDGSPKWAATPEGIVTLAPSEDGMTCDIIALPLPADVTNLTAAVTATVDADLRPDSELDIVGSASVTVTTGQAVAVALTLSDPVNV